MHADAELQPPGAQRDDPKAHPGCEEGDVPQRVAVEVDEGEQDRVEDEDDQELSGEGRGLLQQPAAQDHLLRRCSRQQGRRRDQEIDSADVQWFVSAEQGRALGKAVGEAADQHHEAGRCAVHDQPRHQHAPAEPVRGGEPAERRTLHQPAPDQGRRDRKPGRTCGDQQEAPRLPHQTEIGRDLLRPHASQRRRAQAVGGRGEETAQLVGKAHGREVEGGANDEPQARPQDRKGQHPPQLTILRTRSRQKGRGRRAGLPKINAHGGRVFPNSVTV